jgi:hypothetical protein
MNFNVKLSIAAIIIIAYVSALPASAQRLASDKTLNEHYNKKIDDILVEQNKSKESNKLPKEKENLPSMLSSLKDVAKLKMKNTHIDPNRNSTLSNEEKEKKLISNSPELKRLLSLFLSANLKLLKHHIINK